MLSKEAYDLLMGQPTHNPYNVGPSFMEDTSKNPEKAARLQAANKGLKKHFSKGNTYRDWLHDSNTWARRTMQKVPGAIPYAIGGAYDLLANGIDAIPNYASLAWKSMLGKGNQWHDKKYLRTDNNWGYKVGDWLTDKVGRPVESTLNMGGQLIDMATSADGHYPGWYGKPQYSKALQKADPYNIMGMLEDAGADAITGGFIDKLKNPLNYKAIKKVMGESGLDLKDYDIADFVPVPDGGDNVFIRANRHISEPDAPNFRFSTPPGAFNTAPVWGSPASRPALAQRFGGSEPLLPKNNQTFKLNYYPGRDGSPMFLFDDRYVQKWSNGRPVITKDIPYDPNKNISLRNFRHRPKPGVFSGWWPDERKILANQQGLVPRKSNVVYNAINDKKLAHTVGLDDDSFNLMEVVRNVAEDTKDVKDVFLPSRFIAKPGKLRTAYPVDYLHLVRKGDPSLHVGQTNPLDILAYQKPLKNAVYTSIPSVIPESQRTKQ